MSQFTRIREDDEKDSKLIDAVLNQPTVRKAPIKFTLKEVQVINNAPPIVFHPNRIIMKNKHGVKVWDQSQKKIVYSTKNSQGPHFIFREEPDRISDNMIETGHWERAIIERAKQYVKPDSIVLDIGANIGTWSIELAQKCKSGHVYSFEPQKTTFMQLCGNIFVNRIENITPFQVALGNSEQHGMVFDMDIHSTNNGASYIHDDNQTKKDNKVKTSERVEMVALDYYEFKNVRLIKMDVEGFEVRVLEGAINTIMDSYPIVFFEALTRFPVHRKYLFNIFHILGYTIYKVPESNCPDFFAIPPSKEFLKGDEEKTKLSLLKSLFQEYGEFVEKNSYRS